MPVVAATVAVGWAITTLGWIVSPVMARLLNEAFALLGREALAPEDKEVTLSWLALLCEQADQIGLRDWATSLRSAFYDVEDMVDAAKYDDLANKVKPPSGIIKKFLQRLLALKKVSKLQKKLENLQGISKQGTQIFDNFKKSVGMPPTPPPTTITRPNHTKVFGRDKDRSDILKMLHEASNSVIGIYGVAGSGKTTLAQYVCEYEQKQSYFSSVIWIDVSQCFDVDKIYHQMLEAASGKPCLSLCNCETLRRMLDAELGGKRFLMVLDGLRESVEDKRNELIARLNNGTEGSKILVTTWSKDVAVSLGANNPIKIRQLNEQDFLDLIMHHADPNRMVGKERRQELQELGREIAKRLERSPFVAKEVGGQPRKNLVDVVVKYPTRELCPNTMRELWQSYTHLDEPVRRCFAYCSMFPRRYQFKRDALIKLWMAQGFIEAKHARKMEDIGEDYFNELVSWSFMQSGGNPAYGDDDMWFTIPDMLHELAEEVAGIDCLRVQGNEEVKKFHDPKPFLSRVRHLFITSRNAMRFKSDIYKMKKLRTLIISDDKSGITVEVFKCMLKELRKLRVVQIHHLYADKLKTPECVCDLKHLRFLSISGPNLRQVEMPKAFGELYHLQTIECPPSCYLNCSKVKNMSNLENLRHTYDEFSRFKLD